MKLAAVLACRNQSSRLYAKPLQNLDVKNQVTILDYLVGQLKMQPAISEIVLAISDREENVMYKTKSAEYGISYIIGDDQDVLGRLIKGAAAVKADHIFRVTTESPYPYLDTLAEVYTKHCADGLDYSGILKLPDGASYQIIAVEALQKSWDKGESRHRSELCGLYIREHQDEFKIVNHEPALQVDPQKHRLTVDWPEDLVVMREIYKGLALQPSQPLRFEAIIEFLEKNPRINQINNWIDSGIGRAWY